MDDQREATYQRFRDELKAGRELPSERRLQIRQDIEADPNLAVDRTVPKDFITDEELEAKFEELAKWKAEIAAKQAAARQAGGRRGRASITPNFIEAVWDVSKTPSPTYILNRGGYLAPANEADPGIPLDLDDQVRPVAFAYPMKH